MKTFKLSTLAVSLSAALLATSAHAVLERVGPTVQANGYPAWYQDTTGVVLDFCSPTNQAELAGGYCLLLPANVPAVPEVFPGNFFDEHFFWAAGALMPTAQAGKATLTLGVEGAFATGPAIPGNQITFSRIRVVLTALPATGNYKFIHPYGEEILEGVAGGRIFFTDDVGIGARGDFTGAMASRLGPYLMASDQAGGPELAPVTLPETGRQYIADPARSGTVTGSPLPPFLGSDGLLHDHNIFRIEGPVGSNLGGAGIDYIETHNFNLMGRIFNGTLPGLVTVDRASYAATATEQKVDVYATAYPTAGSRLPADVRPAGVTPVTSFYDAPCEANVVNGKLVSYAAPATAANEILMRAEGTNRYGQIRPAVGTRLPDAVCIKDNSAVDVLGNQISVYHPLPVNDEVRITEGTYDPVAQTLVVTANSSDLLNPPTLTLTNNEAVLIGGTITVSGVTAPPAKVSVLSSSRGRGEYAVSSAAAQVAPTTVVANADFATTNEDVAVTIAVLNGDLINGAAIDLAVTPAVLTIVSNGSKGTAVVNANGTVTYTPRLNANGVDSFTYHLSYGGVISNIATVTVNIAPVNDAPVGVADTAIARTATPTTINVLANDTDVDGDTLSIAAGSIVLGTGVAGSTWTATANVDGTVAFTASLAGTYRFTYQATDGLATTAAVPVTVTVTAPDTITVGTGDYTTKTNRWKVTGTTSLATTHNMILTLTSTNNPLTPCNAEGRVLGTIPSIGTNYTFDFTGTGLLDPRTTNCNRIRVDSSLGGKSALFAYRLR